jgi:hypothetical protein
MQKELAAPGALEEWLRDRSQPRPMKKGTWSLDQIPFLVSLLLQENDVSGTVFAALLHGVELHTLTFTQGAVTTRLRERREVHEYVRSTVLSLNEAIALCVVEPLDQTGHHLGVPSCKPKTCKAAVGRSPHRQRLDKNFGRKLNAPQSAHGQCTTINGESRFRGRARRHVGRGGGNRSPYLKVAKPVDGLLARKLRSMR